MEFKDKNNQTIKDGDAILFSLEDEMEIGGFAKIVSNVELCFYSKQLDRYLPLSLYASKSGALDDVNVVINHIDPKNEDI
jgi:hypothetical protein